MQTLLHMRENLCSFAALLALTANSLGFSQSPSPTPAPAAKPSPQSPDIIEIPIPEAKHSALYGLEKDPSLIYAPESIDSPDQENNIRILSDNRGFDFGPYMRRLKVVVENNWYKLAPEAAQPPAMKTGIVRIELTVLTNGTLRDMKIVRASGDAQLDHASWFALKNSAPLPALPAEFTGAYLRFRCSFVYNQKPAPGASPSPTASSPSPSPSPTPN